MKKIGIMSMHRIFNYGSFLQAYALKEIFLQLGVKVQFVDYHVGQCLIPAKSGTGVKRKINKVMEVFKYNAPFKEKIKFVKYKKNYASNYFPYLGITNELNYDTDLDLLVIGSDEVFNCVQDNTNIGYSKDLFGFNCKAKKLITYAASFGNTTIDKLNEHGIKDEVAQMLKNFNVISVRDKNSGEVVEKLTRITPKYNLDPVLTYDFINECKNIPEKMTDEKYMILYGYSGRFTQSECELIKAYAKKKNLKIFCIGGVQDACDKFIDCNPFEVISYFKNAQCVVTDTFHGTILSVITHRCFASFVRNTGYGNSEKMMDLLTRLNLTSRVVNKVEDVESMLNIKIDYDQTDKIIKEQRENAFKYLKEQIEE